MRIRVFDTADRLARALAVDIARCVRRRPNIVLGLPTGRTPIPLYRELVALYRRGGVDFSRATTFNLDEFVGIAADDPRSYHAFMRQHLFDHVNLHARRTYVLDGTAADLTRECDRYERAIARAGGIDIQLLGLGANGHIGFNEPAAALVAKTHRTALRDASRRANASWFDNQLRAVPHEALSMGMATILHARRVVLIATGAMKARCVEKMIRGPVTPKIPASFLQLHQHAEVWLDASAAARLQPARDD
ncbi:MAG TPA: glucosamine-6-phosphate deaminase [Vicinamibacterales bacterium]|nr:glucosamine-6-phosphate deaminase [Vicinamibacterales bacterium]